METYVDWNGKKTTIPHPSVPVFRLLCEQYGVFAKWDTKDKKLLLEKKDLKEKKVCLISKSDKDSLAMNVLRSVEHFLSETGMEVLVYSNPPLTPRTGDVILECTMQQSKRIQGVDSTLYTTAKPYPRILVESLQKDFRNMKITNKVHRMAGKKTTSPFVHLELKHPDMDEESQHELIELISISLASGILRYFQEKHPMILLASLSPDIRQTFFNLIPGLQQNPSSVMPSEDIPKPEESESKIHHPEVIKNSGIDHIKVVEPPTSTTPLTTPIETKAEVFFDYTLMVPTNEDDEWMILGNLNIKNTGNQPLYNPNIILHVSPSNGVNIGGQILPPNAVETLGVQDGVSWTYLDENYLRKGREDGEYRIGPTAPLIIQPGQTEAHGLQLSIIKCKVEGAVVIKGAIQFGQQGLQFPANNQITITL